MRILCNKISIIILCILFSFQGFAQRMVYEVSSNATIYLKAVYNEDLTNHIDIFVDSSYIGTIAAGSSLKIDKICHHSVKAIHPTEGTNILWSSGDTTEEWEKTHPDKVESSTREMESATAKNGMPGVTQVQPVPVNRIISKFKESLEQDSFYSSRFVQTFNDEFMKHSELMGYLKDKNSREDYIQKHRLREYLRQMESFIIDKEDNADSYIGNFLIANFSEYELPQRSGYETKLRNILEEKISDRKEILDAFYNIVCNEDLTTFVAKRFFSGESIVINVAVAFFIICLFILIIILIRRANKKKKTLLVQAESAKQNAQTDIVVRRKTTSILKKQSLEDVQHNNAYLKIDCADFCSDSAVRRIYLKNTCIKDIYNLYAEDLRNPDNPKEDGCMVVGRWVHDEQNNEYYVSLEEIVKPGDDAIFQEYELNFGGKIKLKVAEKLRRLRRETNLQYDMTCWVHSHPGLGVFFSNADSSVQMQLKHPTHPKFLVAIVIDILTPDQELGIFTFKHDLSINSKADLKRMYSLEELYKWAVASDRASFKPEDYRNIMQNAAKRVNSHYGIELSNGAIIDMCQLQTKQENELLAWVHGYTCKQNGKTEYVLTSVSQDKSTPDNELLGCYINGAHCSIPTIKRLIANDLSSMNFILFYSTSEDVLTAIPVVDGLLSMDENYYGEEKLEELKIWTRRKR